MKGIFSGILISLGAYTFLSIGGIVGAVLFAFGIVSIVMLEIPLYTGIAGTNVKFKDKMIVLAQNVLGALLAGVVLSLVGGNQLDTDLSIVNNKLATVGHITFIKAIFCGLIVDVAVFLSKKYGKTVAPLIMGIPAFIICSFNHSIADSFYIGMTVLHNFNWVSLLYLVNVIVGNYIGCNIRQICLHNNAK